MEVKTVKQRKPDTILLEMDSLKRLIAKRRLWLEANHGKKSWPEVKKDTDEMVAKLDELREEFKHANN